MTLISIVDAFYAKIEKRKNCTKVDLNIEGILVQFPGWSIGLPSGLASQLMIRSISNHVILTFHSQTMLDRT